MPLFLIGFLLFNACEDKDSSVRPEPEGANAGECADGADNDYDGIYDCNDSDCFGAPDCQNDDTGTEPDTGTESVDEPSAEAGMQIAVDPNPLDLGSVYVGCDTSKKVNIYNVGTEDLEIYSFEHTGGVFQLHEQPTLPSILSPGTYTTVKVKFTPTNNEETTGILTVLSNDSLNDGVYPVGTVGTGAFINEYIQTWEHQVSPPSDILFSVDLSCSMDDDAALLASNFDVFINELSNYSNDWQIMVVNNDSGCSNSGILTPSTSGYQSVFSSAVTDTLQEGQDTERLLTIASRAIEQTDPSECNAGFMRSNAMLHVIMVSDEPEQSYDSWSSLSNQIIAKKGDINNVRLSAIAGLYPESSCAYPGTGYWDAVSYTGGVYLDICSDWSTPSNLQQLAEASIQVNSYPLEHPAAESTIEVFVNGTHLLESWHYDLSTNSVIFDVSPPQEGDFVMITYAEMAVCE